jgi:hypothetical protein
MRSIDMDNSFQVRPARESDLDALAVLEQHVWSPLGTPVLSREDLAAWFAECSPFFLVAEHGGQVCGSYFGRLITLTKEKALGFLDPSHATGKGFSAFAHEPGAPDLYGINILSDVRGAGRALYEEVHLLKVRMRIRYSIAFTRLTGLASFLMERGPVADTDAMALWYAQESARLLGLRVWPECVPALQLALSPLHEADAMLAFHTKGTQFGLLGVLPNYMPDPASSNYVALIFSDFPHR